MGCKAITPHLVGLAERLEDAPFHLVATHCQNNPKDQVVAYIRSKGVSADSPNFTVSSFGGHPAVKGNGFVPYYMVFDHHGDLVHHHMGGAYHGGDGLKMIELVDELLADAPQIYLGREPFEHEGKLAELVAGRARFPSTVVTLEKAVATDSGSGSADELRRMVSAMEADRDTRLAAVTRMLGRRPSGVVAALQKLAKDYDGCETGASVRAALEKARADPDMKSAVVVEKALAKIRKAVEKRKACKSCRRDGTKLLRVSCPTCRSDHAGALDKAVKKLEKLAAENPDLPVTETVRAYLAELRGG